MVATPRSSEFSLRRAAILLSNLDAESRRRVLAHLPPRDAANLRAATASLADVDPLEVRRTVSAFVGRISIVRDQPTAPVPAATGTRGADVARPGASGPENSAEDDADESSNATPEGRLQFLHDVPDETLLRAVHSEHPQTIAVVLASIDPRQAARLLRRLEPQQRGEAIRRLGRLEDLPQDAIDDIGRHLRDLIGSIEQLGTGEGRRKLASIFSALGAEDEQWFDQNVALPDGVVAAAWAEAARGFPRRADAGMGVRPANASGPANGSAAGGRADDEDSPRILPMDRRSMVQRADPDDLSDTAAASSTVDEPGEEPPMPQLSADRADEVLERLTPMRLRAVLAELPARESLLTVCGLSSRSARRLLRAMPRRQAKEVRQRLNSLGPLELWEVDRAKRAAAAVALGEVPRGAVASTVRAA